MGRPGADTAAAVVVAATVVVSGCGAPGLLSADAQEKDDPTPEGLVTERDLPPTDEPSAHPEEEDDEEEDHADGQLMDSEHDWDGGAIETTTDSGVTFAVPADWERFSEAEVDSGQEAVYLWEETDTVYVLAESSVFNMGEGEPTEGVTAYMDVMAGMSEDPQDLDPDDPEEFDVPGANDAVRVDYSFAQPGFEDTAVGSVIGFTATTGELVVFTVAGDGENATSDLNEEIISTLLVGAPPGGGV